MPRNSISITTLKKNITREGRSYYVKHQTHRLIQRLAQQESIPVGMLLDTLIEQVARLRLPPQEVERIIAQGREEQERRQQEALAHHDELMAKRQQKKQQKAANE